MVYPLSEQNDIPVVELFECQPVSRTSKRNNQRLHPELVRYLPVFRFLTPYIHILHQLFSHSSYTSPSCTGHLFQGQDLRPTKLQTKDWIPCKNHWKTNYVRTTSLYSYIWWPWRHSFWLCCLQLILHLYCWLCRQNYFDDLLLHVARSHWDRFPPWNYWGVLDLPLKLDTLSNLFWLLQGLFE